ncbi:MAG: hypothetical protein HY782_07515 [Chloroflexi bacterium]|nr:hypothetical protein [Chloroflexota bacterium]
MTTTAIELAPNWKRSLALASPLILGTLPLTMHPRGGGRHPRVIEVPGGVMLRTGAANPGLPRVLRDNERVWASSPVPIIVALAAQGARDWPAMAARLERVPGVGAVELHLNPTIAAADAVRATRAATELPILAKLDLDQAVEIAAECLAAGANTLVIGRAPRGMVMRDGHPWYGRLYSPMVKPLVMRAVAEVAARRLDAPLVACGGVHSADDVREFLAAGAVAVEIDSAMWVDPQVVARIAGEVETG